jgi:transcriptional regulator with XRE-family HTH domain
MERQFCINWQAIVEEAKQRRKVQGLTQSRLAKMAEVSTPTVSRFESGEEDIQLSTVISILTVLGMNDQRTLIFSERIERYVPSRMVVLFRGQDGDKEIICAVSEEAIEDHFHGEGKDTLKIFQANREKIEHEARRKYLAGRLEADGSVFLKTEDIDQ